MDATLTSDELFSLFEHLLSSTSVRHSKSARCVLFDVLDAEPWLFDPKCKGALFSRVDRARAVDPDVDDGLLRIHCKLELVARLLAGKGFSLNDDDIAWFDGDADHLLPLADALRGGRSALGIRMAGV
jgi:hypothetical protein